MSSSQAIQAEIHALRSCEFYVPKLKKIVRLVFRALRFLREAASTAMWTANLLGNSLNRVNVVEPNYGRLRSVK